MPSHAMPPKQARQFRRAIARARLRGIVRGLPGLVPVIVAWAIVDNGRQEHAALAYYAIGVIAVLAVAAGIAGTLLAGRWVADRSVRPRRRWLYVLFAAGYAAPVAALVLAAIRHGSAQDDTGWAPMAGGLTATFCTVAALVMIGRAVTWGRLRSAFYVCVPQWLSVALSEPEWRGDGGR
ncbi:MAG TPA: hypothetical protein VEL03_03180 [Streptosporangiaceae bacterium]|nr:hypothetical protein [Streptosporangiaceae bacterium]